MNNYVLRDYNFSDAPTLFDFYNCDKEYVGVVGPIGSGKSSGCVQKIFKYMINQQPDNNGVRYTKWAIVRNTSDQLKKTTKATIDHWFKDLLQIGAIVWRESDKEYWIKFALSDGTKVESVWILKALDRPDQGRDVLSLELTGVWFNEAREIQWEIVRETLGRCGRYPETITDKDGNVLYGATWSGAIFDTNPCDYENWFYDFFEVRRRKEPDLRDSAEIFHQPSGLSDKAENTRWLQKDYYKKRIIENNGDPDYIKVMVHGEYGYLKSGKPVFSQFVDSKHVSKEILEPMKGIPIVVGIDTGGTPCAVFVQYLPSGKLNVLDEIVTEDYCDHFTFAEQYVKPLLVTKYREFPYVIYVDPENTRSSSNGKTPVATFQSAGLSNVKLARVKGNDINIRLSAVNRFLSMAIKGEPAFQISCNLDYLRKGFNGEYKYKKMRVSGNIFADKPDKIHPISDVMDALQYACIGVGGGQLLEYREHNYTPEVEIPQEAWT